MSEDRVTCPNCGQTYSSQAAVPGYPFECVKCEQEFIPGKDGAAPTPPSSGSSYNPDAMEGYNPDAADPTAAMGGGSNPYAPASESFTPYNPDAPAESEMPGLAPEPLGATPDTAMRQKTGPVEHNPFAPGAGADPMGFHGHGAEHKGGKTILLIGILVLFLAGGGVAAWKSGMFAPYSDKVIANRVPHAAAIPLLDGPRLVNHKLGYELRLPGENWTFLMEAQKLDSAKAQLEIDCTAYEAYIGVWVSNGTVDLAAVKSKPTALTLSAFQFPWRGTESGVSTSAPEDIEVGSLPAIAVPFETHHRVKSARVPMEGRLIIVPGASHTYIFAVYAIKGDYTYIRDDVQSFLESARIKG